jgi:hypothetical protein
VVLPSTMNMAAAAGFKVHPFKPEKGVWLSPVHSGRRMKLWFAGIAFGVTWVKMVVLVVKWSPVSVMKTRVLHTNQNLPKKGLRMFELKYAGSDQQGSMRSAAPSQLSRTLRKENQIYEPQ